MNQDMGRTWSNAPSGVRDARALAWLGLLGSTLMLILTIIALTSPDFRKELGLNVIIEIVYSFFFPLYVWLLIALKRGVRAAYYVQMIVAIIGLIGFPLGTLINGYILYKWFRPETKAWFGI